MTDVPDSPRARLRAGILWASGLQALPILLLFAQALLLARLLDLATFGSYAIAMSLALGLSVLVDFGLSIYLVGQAAAGRDDPGRLGALLTAAALAKTLLGAVAALATALLAATGLLPVPADAALLALGAGFLTQLAPAWLPQGLLAFRFVILARGAAAATGLLLLPLLVDDRADLIGALLAQALAALLLLLLHHLWGARRGIGFAPPSLAGVRHLLAAASGYFLSRVAVVLYTTLPAFLLGYAQGPAQVALFSASDKIYRGLQQVLQPVSAVLYPWMVAHRDAGAFRWILLRLGLLAAATAATLALGAGPLLELLFGPGFAAGAPVLATLMAVFAVNTVGVLLGYPLLEAHGLGHHANRSVQCGSLAFALVAGGLWLGDALSMLGMALSVLAAETVVAGYRIAVALRLARNADGRS